MAFINLGVCKHTHCEYSVAGSFTAPFNWVFTDQQAFGPSLVSNLWNSMRITVSQCIKQWCQCPELHRWLMYCWWWDIQHLEWLFCKVMLTMFNVPYVIYRPFGDAMRWITYTLSGCQAGHWAFILMTVRTSSPCKRQTDKKTQKLNLSLLK